ncbi:Membrane-associated enzyme, PAP2 (acid phosphatase) superfamily [Marinobacter antarcticus]|uniref:Membrane-associated enzyme, PAP2 (Acid phosphatase) superfamily n=2 Tax=Marinobacter antarcticus TaxID=564117 RepID=A0A1M6Q272_9GAMM|nr:Membrane-associated enzyme, PAP2 (acid phosphatase) superfamily [Marinobacter antarcticus]
MITKDIWLSLFVLLFSFLIFELTPIDLAIQDYFFNFKTNGWVLDKNAVIPKLIFYDGIKRIYILFVVTLLIILIFFRQKSIIVRYKKGIIVVLISCIFIPLFIGFLKYVTNVPCPKDIQHYGGVYPYVSVLSEYPSAFQQTGRIKCYPAGHASGGFSLMSLYFLFSMKRNRKIALVSAISIGWVVGSYKMMIGDHFFGHTFITMTLSWLLILNTNYLVSYFSSDRGERKSLTKTCTRTK